MSTEQLYNVVFTGNFVKGKAKEQVITNLAQLFKTDEIKIAQRFASKTVIKKNLPFSSAEQYTKTLIKAGAMCNTVPSETQAIKPPVNRDTVSDNSILKYQLSASDIAFSPLPANRISTCPGGINLNRVDMQGVAFQDIALLSVFYRQSISDGQLLLFLNGYKKPFICDSFKINFTEFDGVKGENMQASIRNFIKLVQQHNPSLLLDDGTANFVQGKAQTEYSGDINQLTTALATALQQRGIDTANTTKQAPPTVSPPPPTSTITKPNEIKQNTPDKTAKPVQAEQQSRPAPLMACPKCGSDKTPTQLQCTNCGIIFAKWQQRLEREQSAKSPTTANKQLSSPESEFQWRIEEISIWQQQGAKSIAIMLLIGFTLPLLKYSIMFGGSEIVWPWQIMGLGIDMQKAAAMATLSSADHMLLWGMLPFISGLTMLLCRKFLALQGLSMTMFAFGTLLLALLLIVFYQEAEILGLMFTPPTFEAGIMVSLVVIAGTAIASSNHIRKLYNDSKLLRWLSGIGGFLLAGAMILQLLIAEGGWSGWSMIILYLIMIAYGIFAIINAFQSIPENTALQRISFLARAALYWAPVACLIAQNWLNDPFVGYVIGGGGGFINIVFSVTKTFLIYYGAALMMAIGFTSYLEQFFIKKQLG